MRIRTILQASCLLASLHYSQAASFMISNAAVIDVNTGNVQEQQDITIQGDRIASIESAQQGPTQAENVFDATGLFAMPGLSDMHVHAYFTNDASQFPSTDDAVFPAFISSGVTHVRDLGSNFDAIRSAQSRIASKQLTGPRITSVGPMLDGEDTTFQTVEKIGSPAEADAVVGELKERGADFIKVHLKLTREAFEAVAEACNRSGIAFGGHVPDSVDAKTAVAAGMTIFEHMSRVETADDIDLLGAGRLWATCTLKQGPTAARSRACLQLQRKGAQVLSGTDAPAGRGLCPGSSLHDELELMAAAGLTPLEVLQASTVNAARAVNMSSEMGTVEAGKLADLALLARNPVEDVRNTRTVAAVVANGTFYSREALQRLRSAANVAQALPFACGDRRAQRVAARSAATCCSV